MLYWQVRKFAGYPISIFNNAIQIFLIIFVPFAFVNYFPAQFLIKNEDMGAYPSVFLYLSPVVGGIMLLVSYLF
ncbi:ABC transporter permease, partial [Klebsiella oxytoca]